MSNHPSFYHRRRLGRAPSPPTWLWYEQIPFDHLQDSDSDISGDSGSGDEEDDENEHDDDDIDEEGSDDGQGLESGKRNAIINGNNNNNHERGNNNREGSCESDLSEEDVVRDDKANCVRNTTSTTTTRKRVDEGNGSAIKDIELCSEDDEDYAHPGTAAADAKHKSQNNTCTKKDVKGKQRAIDPVTLNESISTIGKPKGIHKKSNSKSKTPESTRTSSRSNKSHSSRRRRREVEEMNVIPLRPILTIQKSQGFVWNQDLIVPPYMKDRYIASTSPPSSTPGSSYNSYNCYSSNDYDLDVVEIHVKQGEYSHIIS